jgi:hypothetical protein
MSWFVRALVCASFLIPVDSARAQDECGRDRPWLAIDFEGAWDLALREGVLADLRPSFDTRGVDVCESEGEREEGAARIVLRFAEGEPVSLALFSGEGRIAESSIDLTSVPEDGRSLALSAAIEGLVRARWVELVLRSPRAREPAPAPEAPPDPPVEIPAPRHDDRISLRGAVDVWGGGQVQFGGDLAYARWFLDLFAIEISFGARGGLDTRTELGVIESQAIFGGLSAILRPTEPGSVIGVELFARVRAGAIRFAARAADAAMGQEDWSATGTLGVGTVLTVYPVRELSIQVLAGLDAPLRPVEALADGERATALDGPAGVFGLGVAVEP